MKHLVYGHNLVRPFTVVLLCWIWTTLRRILRPLVIRLRVNRSWRIWGPWVIWIALLVIQGVMLYTLAQLVELCILLMEVWAELAAKHLEITLDRK